MKVHLIKKQTIEDFTAANASSRSSFEDWLEKLKYANWNKPTDIKEIFGSADLLEKSSERVVFNIGGNNYRLICKYYFSEKRVHLYVCRIGTHKDHTKLCNDNEQYTVSNY